jgi:hypothetical protein
MYLGDIRRGGTVRFAFNTASAAGASITRATDGTLKVYKNATAASVSTAGITTSENALGTGVHTVIIDTSADAAFYVPGADYTVVLEGTVVDGQTINATVAEFSIDNRDRMVVSRGQLTAGAGTSFTLPSGPRAEVKVGDALRVVGKGFKLIDGYNSSTGVGTFRSSTAPDLAANDWYEVVSMPDAEPLSAADIATGAIDADAIAADAVTELQAGLATVTTIFARNMGAKMNNVTFAEFCLAIASALYGKVSGMNTFAPAFRDPADTQNVIVAAGDSSGNRSAVTVTP